MFDFNNAGAQRSFDVIPDSTIAVVHLTVRPGGAGQNGIFKSTQRGDAEMLDCEFTVVDGEFAKRKFWGLMLVDGTTDGHAQAVDITQRRLRAILESARGIDPADVSEEAKKRRVAEYEDFDGIRFLAKIGVEPAKGNYKAKNILTEVITPDRKEWRSVEQEAKPAASAKPAGNGTAITKPDWAK